jgi:hypothetical protein
MTRLSALASTIRSKNAGVNQVTFDIIFRDRPTFERVRNSGVLSAERILALYRIPRARMSHYVTFETANAFKFTLYRERPSGSPGDWDILGCQQYGPLLDIEVPD